MKILIIIILPVIYTYRTRKALKKRQKQVNEEWDKVDSILKTRNDIIPELVKVTEKYLNEETINNINNTRKDLLISKTRGEKIINSNKLTSELGYLFSITEDYIPLKENSEFLDIQSKLHDTEDQLLKTKKKYNSNVINYKKKVKRFPSNIVAYIFKFKPTVIFEDAPKKEIKNMASNAEIEKVEVLEFKQF
ncbi:MAG: LemA family protein [Bacilli bacterium]|nr:LemA family protein [Bacilli bacterium]